MAEKVDRHTDGSALAASARAASDGRRFLGSPQDVERIVREFTVGVLERFDEVGHGVLTPSDAASADQAACLKMGAMFTGGDKSVTPLEGWTGKELADYLRNQMDSTLQPEEDDAKLVAQVFAVYLHRLYDHLRTIESAPESELMQTVERDARGLAMSLVGVEQHA